MAEVNMEAIFNDYKKITTPDNYFYLWSVKKQDAQVLYDYIQKLGASRIVVVGAFKGVSTKVILQAIGDRPFDFIANIDPFFDGYIAGDNYKNVYTKAMEGVSNGKILTLEGFASSSGPEIMTCAGGQQPNKPSNMINQVEDNIDLCFLDGDHHFPTCLEDFKLIWPKIKVGGVVLLHDSISWKMHIDLLIEYIKTLPEAEIKFYSGVDGMASVTKTK